MIVYIGAHFISWLVGKSVGLFKETYSNMYDSSNTISMKENEKE